MESEEIRSRFLDFFKKKEHTILPSSSLIPEDLSNSANTLFTTAGMQQFKSYYTAPENALRDFGTKNVATVQKCVRTGDIDEVGDNSHLTFFEMLGNFSFGGYGKEKAIEYAYEFIVEELGLSIDYVSVFEGDSEISADNESKEVWKKIAPSVEIRSHNREENFWGPTGNEGPCGPTTEIYINGVEIWNIVFNEYYKTREGNYEPLKVKGVDTGMGLERLAAVLQKKDSIFETDLFLPLITTIEENSHVKNEKLIRIVADHIRAAIFLIADGVSPSNKDRGYVLRKVLRRARYYCDLLTKTPSGAMALGVLTDSIIQIYKEIKEYDLSDKQKYIDEVIIAEENQFTGAIMFGKRQFDKIIKEKGAITGKDAFTLFSTYALPFELTLDMAKERGIEISVADFQKAEETHKELSRTASAGMFKGGLASHNEKTVKLHTAHHLLLTALQEVLGRSAKQRGSNITEERLRIDFSFERKMKKEEKQKVEDLVNDYIQKNLSIIRREMPLKEAEKIGAEMEFGAKYPDKVSVYFIEDEKGNPISKEFCGGPHVERTGELGKFKIKKEEAVSAGVRRIKAILE